jgi:hypothetical protein
MIIFSKLIDLKFVTLMDYLKNAKENEIVPQFFAL